MNIPAVSDSKWPPDIPPRFPLWQKRREHVQEALVKETGWNDGVAGREQRRVLSVGRDVCYTTASWTQLLTLSYVRCYEVYDFRSLWLSPTFDDVENQPS